MPAAEKSELQSHAKKTNRANGERFLDAVTVQMGLGNGAFGGRVADASEDQEENTNGRLVRWPRNKNLEE
jgi:hypothetical protein